MYFRCVKLLMHNHMYLKTSLYIENKNNIKNIEHVNKCINKKILKILGKHAKYLIVKGV